MSSVSNTERVRALIQASRDANGFTLDQMVVRCQGRLSRSGISAISRTLVRTDVLTRDQLKALADAIGFPYQTVRDAALADAGLVEITGDELPPGASLLVEAMRPMSEAARQRYIRTALLMSEQFLAQQEEN